MCGPSVGCGLHELAERSDADLLVVGSCHHGMLGRAFLGDETGRALNGAPCAVGIAPRGYSEAGSAPRRLSQIGVDCNSSAESAWALEVARTLAARHGSAIRALSVVSLQSIPQGEPIPAEWPKIAMELVEDERRRLGDLDVSNYLARRARCPLLVLPRTATQQADSGASLSIGTTWKPAVGRGRPRRDSAGQGAPR